MKEEIDHENTSEIICPHCGYRDRDSWEKIGDDGETDCDSCSEPFGYSRDVSVTYSTEKLTTPLVANKE